MEEKTCPKCGCQFTTDQPTQRWCGPTCRSLAREDRKVHCPRCGRRFLPQPGQVYDSRECRRGAEAEATACPHPQKLAFPTQEAGMGLALRRSRKAGRPMRVYRCQCGRWHLSSKPERRKTEAA